jgi:hypothetical protein
LEDWRLKGVLHARGSMHFNLAYPWLVSQTT